MELPKNYEAITWNFWNDLTDNKNGFQEYVHQSRYVRYVCLFVSLSVYLSVCLFVCLSVYLSVCLFIYLPVCLFVCLSVYLSVYLSVCLSVYLSVHLSVCLSVYLSVYLSICLPVCLSICMSICLSIYLSVYLSVCLSLCLSICLLYLILHFHRIIKLFFNAFIFSFKNLWRAHEDLMSLDHILMTVLMYMCPQNELCHILQLTPPIFGISYLIDLFDKKKNITYNEVIISS